MTHFEGTLKLHTFRAEQEDTNLPSPRSPSTIASSHRSRQYPVHGRNAFLFSTKHTCTSKYTNPIDTPKHLGISLPSPIHRTPLTFSRLPFPRVMQRNSTSSRATSRSPTLHSPNHYYCSPQYHTPTHPPPLPHRPSPTAAKRVYVVP